MKLHDDKLRALGLAVIQVETQAIAALAERIDAEFVSACKLMFPCSGRVVVTGMGKSGHIAGKIAAGQIDIGLARDRSPGCNRIGKGKPAKGLVSSDRAVRRQENLIGPRPGNHTVADIADGPSHGDRIAGLHRSGHDLDIADHEVRQGGQCDVDLMDQHIVRFIRFRLASQRIRLNQEIVGSCVDGGDQRNSDRAIAAGRCTTRQ